MEKKKRRRVVEGRSKLERERRSGEEVGRRKEKNKKKKKKRGGAECEVRGKPKKHFGEGREREEKKGFWILMRLSSSARTKVLSWSD